MTATETAGQGAPSTPENRYLSGNFAPIPEESTVSDLPVTGSIPDGLCGRLLRIGPNPVAAEEPGDYHWFTGTAMAHGLRLRDGNAEWYRSRYVRSDRVTDARGWPAVRGPRHGEGDGTANTNLIVHAGRNLALVEAGALPVELSYELDTVSRTDLAGSLPGGFTAHPKRDPATGELHAVAYYWRWDYLQYLVVGIDGRLRRRVDVPVAGGPMVHDMALTASFVVLLDLPVTFDIDAAASGASFPYRWNPDHPSQVGLLPRDGDASQVRWFDVEPCYVFHVLNAYDDVGTVVLDVVRHNKMFDTDLLGPDEGPSTLERWRIDPASGRVHQTRLSDISQEFPRHDERRTGLFYRYGYAAAVGAGVKHGPCLKHDLIAGTTDVHHYGKNRVSLEPVFVPRNSDAAEDDGWVLSFVYDATTDTSDVVILAAQDFTGEPIATIHLPVRVPFGFHGNWAPDLAARADVSARP
ncbi:MAG: carotenoid oxygenase family protein [Acidimicrobiales bacterium]